MNAEILERGVTNYEQRIFLESWHSTLDDKSVNERREFPHNYTLLNSHRSVSNEN